eukprot:RCo029372
MESERSERTPVRRSLRTYVLLPEPVNPDLVEYSETEWIRKKNTELTQAIRHVHREAGKLDSRGILQLLPVAEMERVRARFQQDDGVDLDTFVKEMLGGVSHTKNITSEERTQLASYLTDLFHSIDVSANGRVDWNELSEYLVNTHDRDMETRYADQLLYSFNKDGSLPVATRTQTKQGSRVFFFPGLDRYVMVENSTFDQSKVTIRLPTSGLPVVATVPHTAQVVAAEYIPELDRLALSDSLGEIHFYELSTNGITGEVTAAVRKKTAGLLPEQTSGVLRWEQHTGLLYSGCRNGEVLGLRCDVESELLPSTKFHLCPHTDVITDMDLLPSQFRLCTASLDSTLKLLDLSNGEVVCNFGAGMPPTRRHHQGVCSVSYSPDYNVIVSAGFELEPLLWVPIAVKNQCVGKLASDIANSLPHKHNLVGARCIPGSPRIVTVDISGLIKLWDVRKMATVQVFQLQSKVSSLQREGLHCVDFAVNPKSDGVVALARLPMGTRLFSFNAMAREDHDPSKAHDAEVTSVAWNPVACTLVTCGGREAKVWDARTGGLLVSFKDLVPAGDRVSSLCVDEKGRRVVLGTHRGLVQTRSCATLALVCSYTPHKGEVCQVLQCDHPAYILSAAWDRKVHVFLDCEWAPPTPVRAITLSASPMCVVHDPAHLLLLVGDKAGRVSCYDSTPARYVTMRPKLPLIFTATWQPRADPKVRILPEAFMLAVRAQQTQGLAASPTASSGPEDLESPLSEPGSGPALGLHSPTSDSQSEPSEGSEELPVEQGLTESEAIDRTLEQYMNPTTCEVTAVVFVAPFPVYVTATTAATLALWSAEYQSSFQALQQWPTFSTRSTPAVVCSMDWDSTRGYLVTGDDNGYVTVWALQGVLAKAGFELSTSASGSRLSRVTTLTPEDKPVVKNSFSVSEDPVTCLKLFPGSSALVLATMKKVTVWSLKGQILGDFQQGSRAGADVLGGRREKGYTFRPPPSPAVPPPTKAKAQGAFAAVAPHATPVFRVEPSVVKGRAPSSSVRQEEAPASEAMEPEGSGLGSRSS